MRAPLCPRLRPALFACLIVPLSTTACSAFQVGFERTATPGQTAMVTPADVQTPEPSTTALPVQPTASPTGAARPTPTSAATPLAITLTPIPSLSPTPLGPTMALSYACTYLWFFPDPPAGCAGQPPVYSLTVAQHFQRGLMLWRERPDVYGSQIYVFFTDDIWPYWNPTNDRWRSDMPESDPAIDPPAGYYQPVRGFGLFWREAYLGAIGFSARERLGWATDEEFSLGELPMQCHADDGYAPRCYLMGPDDGPSGDGVVYAVRPDSSWWIWEGPTDVPAPVSADPILEPESPDCTSEEWADTVWPQLYEVQLTETAAEGGIRVMGSGGYLYWGGKCGQRYDESERSFRLTFDGEPGGSMGCYVNHCEATLSFPAHALLGTHIIWVEGGSSITIQVTAR